MDQLIFFFNKVIVAGTVLGSIYALGAIGVTLIFGILRFAHFAHGDMMTLGAFIAFVLATLLAATGVTFPVPTGFIVLPGAMLLTAIIALGLDRAFYAPLRKRGARPVTLLIASIGVTLMLQGLIRLFFGTGQYSFFDYGEVKSIYRISMDWAGARPITFTQPQVLMVIVTVVLVLIPHSSPFRGEDAGVLDSPIFSGMAGVIGLLFAGMGTIYGALSGSYNGPKDLIAAMVQGFKNMAPILVLFFAIAQFLAYFKWTGIGQVLAIKGAELLKGADAPGWLILLGMAVIISILNFVITSGSAMWSLAGPVFVPMLMLLGIDPKRDYEDKVGTVAL